MIGREYLEPFELLRADVPKVERFAAMHLHPEHLVEIAIVDFAVVANAQSGAAHQARDGGGVEVRDEQIKVGCKAAGFPQVFGEAGDGLVGDGQEMIENDAVIAGERFFIIGFEFGLWRRELRAERIVDQMQRKS